MVDLWGGLADPASAVPWRYDTLSVLFSGTKGVTATVTAAVIATGALDPHTPVREYWPEFTADVTVGQVLSHTAGLPYVDGDHDLLDSAGCAELLARQRPLWTPGSRVAYHPLTYGYLAGELLRRITGLSVGRLVRDMVAEPYGIDVHLGTPAQLDPRVARLLRAPDYAISTFLHDGERRRIVERMYRGLLDSDESMNSPAYRRAELAAGSATGTARSMARMYDLIRSGTIIPPGALNAATTTWSKGVDAINDRPALRSRLRARRPDRNVRPWRSRQGRVRPFGCGWWQTRRVARRGAGIPVRHERAAGRERRWPRRPPPGRARQGAVTCPSPPRRGHRNTRAGHPRVGVRHAVVDCETLRR